MAGMLRHCPSGEHNGALQGVSPCHPGSVRRGSQHETPTATDHVNRISVGGRAADDKASWLLFVSLNVAHV